MHLVFRGMIAALFTLAVVVALGCGGSPAVKKVNVKGKLLEGANPFIVDAAKLKLPAGKGLSMPPGEHPLRVTFIPLDGGETAPANVDAATGTFTLSLAPGSYKVAISASAGPGTPDFFGNKFSAERTQIRRDVKEGDEITIDVTKPQG